VFSTKLVAQLSANIINTIRIHRKSTLDNATFGITVFYVSLISRTSFTSSQTAVYMTLPRTSVASSTEKQCNNKDKAELGFKFSSSKCLRGSSLKSFQNSFPLHNGHIRSVFHMRHLSSTSVVLNGGGGGAVFRRGHRQKSEKWGAMETVKWGTKI
jgi:hypothetical protein